MFFFGIAIPSGVALLFYDIFFLNVLAGFRHFSNFFNIFFTFFDCYIEILYIFVRSIRHKTKT